jgi:Carboxypeptidase regulatory-like domain
MKRVISIMVLAFLIYTPTVRAQATATTGQIEGIISDQQGVGLPGVMVIARNAGTGLERNAVSEANGMYRLSLLPLGTYEVTAELPGFATLKRGGLILQVGETLTVPMQMQVAGVIETVQVTGEAPVIEVTRSQPAASINETAIDSLPINGRRFQDFILLTPGAVFEPSRGGTSIGGQRGINASYAIDGASYDNPFFGGIRGGERGDKAYTISQEAIQEFQVTNSGYNAEFGRSGGGVVNAITKSGTNVVQGTAFWYFRDENLTADDPFGRPPTDFRQHQFGASAGGPLKRNKAHWFMAYDQQKQNIPFVVKFSGDATGVPRFAGEEGTFTQTNDVFTLLGRMDYQITNDNHFWIRANRSTNTGKNGIVASSPTTSTVANNALEKDNTLTTVAQLSSILSANRLHEFRAQFSREDRPREPNTTDGTITVAGLGTTGRVSFLPSLETDDRYQVLDNFTWIFGEHAVRTGLDFNFTHTMQPFFLSRSAGEYRFNSIADYLTTVRTGQQLWRDFRQGYGRADVDFWQQEYAAYLQDTWNVRSNLTINYGLRYEAQLEPQPDKPNPNLAGSDRIPSDLNNVGPRAGLAWDPWKDNKGVIRFNGGLFYSRTPALLIVSPFTSNGQAQLQLTFTPTSAGAPVFPNILSAPPTGVAVPRSNVNIFDPDFQNPRTAQASVGIEREIFRDLSVSVDFTYARMENLQRLFDINIAPASGIAADGRLVYRNARPNESFNLIDRAESTAKGMYNALTLSAKKRWSGGSQWYNRGLQFQAFYTNARSKDDDSNERKFQDIFYQDWQNLAAEYTWSNNDVRHNFVANGTWAFAGDVQLGAIFNGRSGPPYSRLSSIDLNNDGAPNGNDRQFIDGKDTGRNAFRQPNYYRLDLRIGKSFRLGGPRSVELAADVFNALNAENLFVSGPTSNSPTTGNQLFNGSGPGGLNPNVGVPDAQFGSPRTGQISLRFKF